MLDPPRSLLAMSASEAPTLALHDVEPGQRALVRRAWAGRARAAHGRAAGVGLAVTLLASAGAPPGPTAELALAVVDALRNAARCGQVVVGLDGQLDPAAVAPALDVPGGSGALEQGLRQVVLSCCVGATVDGAVSDAEVRAAADGTRALLESIAAEQRRASAAGWALLEAHRGRIPEDVRAGLASHLCDVLADLFARVVEGPVAWIGTPPALRALGVPDDALTREVSVRTARDVVVPGLEELGLPAQRAWRRAAG